jgi:hypothetical protein
MKKQNKVEMLVDFNDTQLYRNCDEEALGAGLQFLRHYKDQITHFVANGDITDYEQQSKFAKLPDGYQQALDEIQSTKWFFKEIARILPNAEKIMIDGNHDMRWENMMKDQTMGIEHWLKTPAEMFQYKALGWKHIGYGRGKYYRWHDRIFWHGQRAGKKMDVAKAELDDALGLSVTTAHINKNMYHEQREITGKLRSAYIHGGFSKDNLNFVRSANSKWSQGFGVYYWSKETGEQVYPIVMSHGKPRFIYEGKVFDGTGFRIFDTGRNIR